MTDANTLLPPATNVLDQEDEDVWGVTPAPLCSVCEHPLCPMCPEPWCDQISGDDDDLTTCCDAACKVEPLEFADWKQRAAELMLSRDHQCGVTIEEHTCWTVELGPYAPTWRRLVRPCMMCRSRLEEDAPRASYVARGASGLEWYECPEHGELDNLAEDRRVSRVLLCDWLPTITARLPVLTVCEPLPLAPDDPRRHFVAQFWGTPTEGES